jgi:hypothetical protein
MFEHIVDNKKTNRWMERTFLSLILSSTNKTPTTKATSLFLLIALSERFPVAVRVAVVDMVERLNERLAAAAVAVLMFSVIADSLESSVDACSIRLYRG